MGPNNLVYRTYRGRGNVNIAARYTIENLAISKNCVNTHTHTHTHILTANTRALIYIISTNLQSGLIAILLGVLHLFYPYLKFSKL